VGWPIDRSNSVI